MTLKSRRVRGSDAKCLASSSSEKSPEIVRQMASVSKDRGRWQRYWVEIVAAQYEISTSILFHSKDVNEVGRY